MRLKLFSVAVVLSSAAWCSYGQTAAPYPQRPITIVAPYPPGGGADTIARLVIPKLQQALGQPLVLDNRTGASGNIGTDQVVRAKPDGYTLLINNNTLTINASLGLRQPFNVQKDLRPVAAIASTPIVLAVHQSVPARTLAELLALARQQPGKLSYSSCGNGTPQHFAGARVTQLSKAPMVHVPYRGCSLAINDGLSGLVPVLFNTVPNLDTHVQSGKLRYIAVASAKRLPFRADIPTFSETAGFEGFESEVWFGFLAPAATPNEVVRRLEQELLQAVADKDVQKAFADRLIAVLPMSSAQFEKQVTDDIAGWKRLADELRVTLD